MKIIYCGDVVGRPGRDAVLNNVEKMRADYKADAILVNVENAAHGFGVTPGIARDFLDKGVDGLLTGNHVWQQKEIMPFLDSCKKIIRPINYPAGSPGRGFMEIELLNGKKILVVQAMGRVFMEALDCPAQTVDALLKNYTLGKNAAAIFVDIHAEATSEKIAFGYYLDGRVSAVCGTHTHVVTADERILDKGTAYISDVGMCGDLNAVLGFEKEEPINRLLRKPNGGRLSVSKAKGSVSAVLIETDDKTGLAVKIKRIRI